jgi:hypothetical protein
MINFRKKEIIPEIKEKEKIKEKSEKKEKTEKKVSKINNNINVEF